MTSISDSARSSHPSLSTFKFQPRSKAYYSIEGSKLLKSRHKKNPFPRISCFKSATQMFIFEENNRKLLSFARKHQIRHKTIQRRYLGRVQKEKRKSSTFNIR